MTDATRPPVRPSATQQRFTELQERHAMTETSEHGFKGGHSEGERTRGNGAQTTNAERQAFSDNNEHHRFETSIADLETKSALVFFSMRSPYRAVFAMLLWMSKYPSYTGSRFCQITTQTSERSYRIRWLFSRIIRRKKSIGRFMLAKPRQNCSKIMACSRRLRSHS